MPFLPPNQQRQSTEGNSALNKWSKKNLTKGSITLAVVTPWRLVSPF